MKNRTHDIVLAGILTALAILITYSPIKLNLGFFTLTLAAHVPTMLAMFVNPWVAIMSIIGSCIGFFTAIPAPNNFLVVARAALHIIFALVGIYMLKKNRNIFLIIFVTAILHSVAEGVAVYFLTPILLSNNDTALWSLAWVAFSGTFVHHLIDSAITYPILCGLIRAKLISKQYFLNKNLGGN